MASTTNSDSTGADDIDKIHIVPLAQPHIRDSDNATPATTASKERRDENNMAHDGEEEEEETRETLFVDSNLRKPQSIFCMSIFLFEFFTQLLHPFLLPLVLVTQSCNAAANKGFLPARHNRLAFTLSTLTAIVQWTPPTLAIVSGAEWAVEMVLIAITFTIFRHVVVAAKYGHYKTADYELVKLGERTDIGKKLLSGAWKKPPPKIIAEELAEAEQICGIDLSHHHFTLNRDDTATGNRKASKGRNVSCRTYMSVLLNSTFGAPASRALECMKVPPLTMALVYPVWTYYDHANGWKYTNSIDITLVVTVVIQTFFLSYSVFDFMVVGASHYRRMLDAQTALIYAVDTTGNNPTWDPLSHHYTAPSRQHRSHQQSARTEEGEGDDDEMSIAITEEEPKFDPMAVELETDRSKISLFADNNLQNWDRCRSVLRHFGIVYTQRISFNAFAVVAVLIFLLLVLLLQVISGVRVWRTVAYIAVVFFTASVYGLLTIIAAVKCNTEEKTAASLLVHEMYRLQVLAHHLFVGNSSQRQQQEPLSSSSIDNNSANDSDSNAHAAMTAALQPSSSSRSIVFAKGAPSSQLAQQFSQERLESLRYLMDFLKQKIDRDHDIRPFPIMYAPARPELLTAFLGIMFSGLLFTLTITTRGSLY